MLPPKLLLLFAFFLPTLLGAQGILESGALVHYYDGSIFQGEITDENDLQISLRLATKDTITIEKAFMDRFYRIPDDIELYKRRRFHYNSGIFSAFAAGLIINSLDGGTVQFDYIIGKRLNPRLSVGLGAGLYINESYPAGLWIQTNVLPIYAYSRYYLSRQRRRLYVAGRLGYSLPLESFNNNHTGGMMLMPEIGVHFAGRKKTRFALGLGQYLQMTKGNTINFDQFGNTIDTRFELLLNRTVLRLTWEFR